MGGIDEENAIEAATTSTGDRGIKQSKKSLKKIKKDASTGINRIVYTEEGAQVDPIWLHTGSEPAVRLSSAEARLQKQQHQEQVAMRVREADKEDKVVAKEKLRERKLARKLKDKGRASAGVDDADEPIVTLGGAESDGDSESESESSADGSKSSSGSDDESSQSPKVSKRTQLPKKRRSSEEDEAPSQAAHASKKLKVANLQTQEELALAILKKRR